MFCRPEAHWRRRESGLLKIARDDEGNVIDIRQPGSECYDLEVAHTIPLILNPREGNKELVGVTLFLTRLLCGHSDSFQDDSQRVAITYVAHV